MKNNKTRYKQLNQFDRDRIEAMLFSGHKRVEIARVLDRNKSTIIREIKRNKIEKKGGKNKKGVYRAITAGRKAKQKRKFAKYQGKRIEENIELKEYIILGLKNHWNPDEIAGVMKAKRKPFYASKTTIYEWLYSIYGQGYCRYLPSKRYARVKRRRKAKKQIIPNRIGIKMRPEYINNRSVGGHYEADTIVSGKKTGSKVALAVAYERKYAYTKIEKINNMRPDSFNTAIFNFKNEVIINSLTLDNGLENRYWEKLLTKVFFCDPYSSWQKPGVENHNGLIRMYIPKGVDISKYSKKYIKKVENILNNKPRKILGYITPKMAMQRAGLLIEK